MAEPNVAALLAALAGQTTRQPDNRSGAQNQAPALNPQQLAALAQSLGGMGGLAGMQPQQQQPAPLGGMPSYGMPQPSSSGSLDISKIVPSSTGSLSISDAMNRVKSRPNDMGMNNSRYDDPRPSRRRSRSRSRTPPPNRRDRYDGGFRDDRRGGRNYDRERSYSPPRRGGYSPPPRERGGRGGSHTHSHRDRDRDPEVTMYQMRVDSSLVGLIIGRGGETLRRVEQDTGCKVQFLTGNEYRDLPDRPCNITGTPRQIDLAKKAIMQIIDENQKSAPPPKRGGGGGGGYNDRGSNTPSQHVARDGDDNMQIMVPDRTVGLIIGRHGETIRDLQERSGCHINIVGESKSVNGLRPVNLIGPPESARRAKELIMEIVDSDIRSQASGGQPISNVPKLPGGGPSGYFGGAGPSGEKSSQTMKVPIDAVGMIIGRGGETIKEMQASTGCRINVSSSFAPSDTEREITLQGTPESIDQARAMISDKVHSSLTNLHGQRDRKPPSVGGGRGRDDYDNQYSSPPPQHRQQQQHQQQPSSGTAPAASGAAAAAGGEDPYAPWGGYEAYAQMYWAMMQQQAAAGGAGGAPGAPGTS